MPDAEQSVPLDGTLVAEHEDLRRAIRPDYFTGGEISDGAFRSSKPLSLDVASMCTLQESRERKRTWHLAVLPCSVFIAVGCRPVHAPIKDDPFEPDNTAHAEIRQKLKGSQARALALEARRRLCPPLSSG